MKLSQIAYLPALLLTALVAVGPAEAQTLAEKVLANDFVATAEQGVRDEIMTAVGDSLWNRRFDELEAMAAAFRARDARTPSGLWKLNYFYEGLRRFQKYMPRDPDPQIDGWLAAKPESVAAHIGYAVMTLQQAWEIRGEGYASTVEPEDWKPFHNAVERARKHLMQYKAIADGDPHWYDAMLEVATLQNWDDAAFDALLREALDKEPLYYDFYFHAANRNLPKWGGSAEKVEELARDAVARTQAIEGAALYARIYWSANGSQFEESEVDWKEMRKGIDDVLARYPDQWNINNFARFACLAHDEDKTYELIARMAGEPDPAVWGYGSLFERCKRWSKPTGG
jgi:hypothetical protein